MPENNSAKSVVITGVSKGIGRYLAEAMAAKGYRVYGCSRSPQELDRSIEVSVVDIRIPEQVEKWAMLVTQMETKIDLLINNAAILGARASFVEIDKATWRRVIDTNLLGGITVIRAFFPLLVAAKRSTIINIGSIVGRFGRAGWTPYAVSKAGLEGLTQALAQEFACHGIRVVNIHPPRVTTDLRSQAYPREGKNKDNHLALALVFKAAEFLVENQDLPVSGLTVAANDLSHWSL